MIVLSVKVTCLPDVTILLVCVRGIMLTCNHHPLFLQLGVLVENDCFHPVLKILKMDIQSKYHLPGHYRSLLDCHSYPLMKVYCCHRRSTLGIFSIQHSTVIACMPIWTQQCWSSLSFHMVLSSIHQQQFFRSGLQIRSSVPS